MEIDGVVWRLLPAEAVVGAGLTVGRSLDREAARALGRELRRAEALGIALRALRSRDQSRRRLEERLRRRRASGAAGTEALDALERAGLLDDAGLAARRAEALAERGYGDHAVRFTLEREGVPAELVAEAIAGLEPEPERARRLLAGTGDRARALRRLAARGFDASTLEDVGGFAENA